MEERPVLLPLDVACECNNTDCGAFICANCSRVVPWCFGGDELCDDCHEADGDDGDDDDDDQDDDQDDDPRRGTVCGICGYDAAELGSCDCGAVRILEGDE